MHLRPDHAVLDLPTLHAFIRAHPLGVLTTSLSSESFPTLQCSHIPWVLDSENTRHPDGANGITNSNGTNGTEDHPSRGMLRGHIARQNPQAKAMIEAVTTPDSTSPNPHTISGHATLPGEVLIIFTSPVDHYITPHFYTESKPATAKVAPTWNYAAVQVYGRATIYHGSKDQATGEFLHRQLSDLAVLGEQKVMGYELGTGGEHKGGSQGEGASKPPPWQIADAPGEYIAMLKKNIVGMHIDITRIEGRFKVSQERPVHDRAGVVDGLETIQTERAREMARFVKSGRVVSAPE